MAGCKYVPIGLALIGTGVGCTGVVGPLLGGVLVDSFGWRALFWFVAAFVLVLTPLLLTVVPESPGRVPDRVARGCGWRVLSIPSGIPASPRRRTAGLSAVSVAP
ncbi:MFS transporter [Nocardia sp. NPDC050408]|uniref:MFS transporter n=1 Tax=unclassified Nocardia TaxID=2637762 RepID=UPI003432F384